MSESRNVSHRNFKFFRILLPGFTSKMCIPHNFAKFFVQENSTWATILSPLGKSWHVKLSGDSESLHFAEGWEKFAVAHNLQVGDFLVFKYIGGMIFNVNIFDHSTCERDYNVINKTHDCRKQTTPSRGKKIDSVMKISKREFKRFKKQITPLCGKSTAATIKQPLSKHQLNGSEYRKSQVHDLEETTNGHKKDPSFEITIKSYHKLRLILPCAFTKSSDLSSIRRFLLRDPNGHLWPAKLLHRRQAATKIAELGAGWREFHRGNGLEDGDVCVFELKQNNEMHVQIRIRGGHNPIKISDDGSTDDAPPRFESTIIPINLDRKAYLNIPASFLSTIDMSSVRQVTLVDQNSRRWPVSFYHRKEYKRASLGTGWRAFCDVNDVQVGDTCVFIFKSKVQDTITIHVEVIKFQAGATLVGH